MESDGLEIGRSEFNNMSRKGKDAIMFENLLHIRKRVDSDKITKKIQYIWLLVLSAALGFKRVAGF